MGKGGTVTLYTDERMAGEATVPIIYSLDATGTSGATRRHQSATTTRRQTAPSPGRLPGPYRPRRDDQGRRPARRSSSPRTVFGVHRGAPRSTGTPSAVSTSAIRISCPRSWASRRRNPPSMSNAFQAGSAPTLRPDGGGARAPRAPRLTTGAREQPRRPLRPSRRLRPRARLLAVSARRGRGGRRPGSTRA